jgi:hypothetical protein
VKALDQVFAPDIASLDVRIGPVVLGQSQADFEHAELAKLHCMLSSMVCIEQVPAHVRQNIELAKNLLLYSTYVFDFTTAAVHYAQIAFEASLRRALGKSEECRDNLDMMLDEASRRNVLPRENHQYIAMPRFVSGSRNGFAHGKEGREVLNQALAIPFVEMIVGAINALFSDDCSKEPA